MADEVSLELIGQLLREMQVEQRAMRGDIVSLKVDMREVKTDIRDIRHELRDLRTITLNLVDQQRLTREELDRRFRTAHDDLEMMIRSESMGRSAHFETRYERKVDDLAERVAALETRDRPN